MHFGALEAGGTKMVMGLLDENLNILRTASCKTTSPDETLPEILNFFRGSAISAMGIASFGPIGLKKDASDYGFILNTPKTAWQNYDLLGAIRSELKVPCGFDTDVNAAALAEALMGVAKGTQNCLYLTVGTGIGGGLLVGGKLVHGLLHPEWGHILLNKRQDDPLERGVCPFHPNCAEGLAAGPSIKARWGIPAQDLLPDHPAWDLEAYYLAQVCQTAIMTVSPEKIILGGGVMHQKALYPMIAQYTLKLLNGYLSGDRFQIERDYIVAPALYPDSGLIGAGLLAKEALNA